MPVQGRNPRDYDGHHQVFAVSGWVRDGLLAANIPTWTELPYGVANLKRSKGSAVIRRGSYYDWDQRKLRDRLLGVWEPLLS